ncbi:hypothetical protein G6011_02299 [Alternaria panax]|uniref:HTH CENPB-type domain-containing protein n=1 Tax=Alternaria panax TaxID=48097 RepID=A0AAD4FEX1_9PLEO|nr:hypothetical protein G6011_02299 [Alternaria panax]
MDPIQEAIAEIESREPGDEFSYQAIAKKYSVPRTTLMRRHKGESETYGLRKLSLHPEHEAELVRYIKTLTERRLPPTRTMVQQFASELAGKPVSETWVSRFLRRHPNHLISRSGKAMAKERTKADSGAKYSLYFKLLHEKIEEYNIQPIHIFNMDEKGFQLSRVSRTKRIFDRRLYEQKGLKLKSIVRRKVKDQGSKDVKKLQRSLCHIAAQNSILHEENRGLRQSLAIKERRPKQSFTLQLNRDKVYHGGAKLWSPRSVQRARDRQASQQQQQELKKLQKAEKAEADKAARLCKLQLQKAKRLEQERG